MLKKSFFKYTIVMSLCVLASVFSASAQLKFGLKAGLDVAESKINKDILNTHNRLGFQVGPTINVGVPLIGLGLESGLLYGHKEYTVKEKQNGEVSDYDYLMVPLNLKKSFSVLSILGVYGKAGAYGEFKLSGGDFKLSEDNAIYQKIKSKSFGVGLNFGVGVSLFSKLEVGMDYRFRLNDNYDDVDVNTVLFKSKKDKTWNVNLTYLF